jgi:type IV pilus assembly protein PilW
MAQLHRPDTRQSIPQGCNRAQRRLCARGFSLVELMIALVIGLLGIVIIFQVFSVSESNRRTTVGRGDAQNNGAIAMYTLERYIRSAGGGITTTNEIRTSPTSPMAPNGLLGCLLSGLPSGTAPTGIPALRVAPVLIIDGSDSTWGGGAANPAASDTIFIMSGTADVGNSPTGASPILTAGATTVSVQNLFGINPPASGRLGDIALVTNRAKNPPTLNVSDVACGARRITATTGATGTGTITLASGLPVAYDLPAVHNMGPVAYFFRLRVNAQSQLVETDFTPLLLGTGAATDRILADGIVNLQAQYGIDQDQDDVIDAWVEPAMNATVAANAPVIPAAIANMNWSWNQLVSVDAPGTAVAASTVFSKIKALRIAVVARSSEFEPAPSKSTGHCNAADTTQSGATAFNFPNSLLPLRARARVSVNDLVPGNIPAMPAGAFTQAQFTTAISATGPSTAARSDWRCFRYRLYESIVPVRNMLWSPL